MKNANSTFLYMKIANNIERQIIDGVLKLGDKLPSIRVLHKEYGVSVSTVQEAYYYLESKSLISSRPKSGYFVIHDKNCIFRSPKTTNPPQEKVSKDACDIFSNFYQNSRPQGVANFAWALPAPELLPVAKLKKSLHETIREAADGGTNYDTIEGSVDLRRQIAQRTLLWGGNLSEKDVIITSGCINALSLAFMAITEPGDTIVVESPVYFGVLQLANQLGLNIIELPTCPIDGMDIDALRTTLAYKKVNAILIVTNFNNPIGSIMPDENKKELVKLLEQYQVPLIEDDIYGDLYFGKNRPSTCKYYDESGLVIWCSSFSKTLAPGYRIGWIAPGRYMDKILKLKRYHSIATNSIFQNAIYNFLVNGRYDHHLRKLRTTYCSNSHKILRGIKKYFPEDTLVSNPKGGFLIWIELNEKVDTQKLHERANKYDIDFCPGRMFTLQNQYNNCLRLSFGMVWDEKVERALQKLGELANEMINEAEEIEVLSH